MTDGYLLGVLLLAAGASRRFRGIKQLARLSDSVDANAYMLQAALTKVSQLPSRRKLVAMGANKETILAEIALPNDVQILPVDDWEEGIAASIRGGVSELQDCSHMLIMLADQPDIRLSDYTSLIGASRHNVQNIICARYAQKNAVPAIFPASCFSFLLELTGDKGAAMLLNNQSTLDELSRNINSKLAVYAVTIEQGAFDIDTQTDLAAWRQHGNIRR